MNDLKKTALLSNVLLLILLAASISLQAIPMESKARERTSQPRPSLDSIKNQDDSRSVSSLAAREALGIGIAESSTERDENEGGSFSDEELNTVLQKAIQAQERWKAIHVDVTTSPTAIQELVDQLEQDEDLWESKQEQLNFLAEQMEAPEKLQLAISACDQTLNILRGYEPQLLPKKRRSYRSDSSSTDEGPLDQAITTALENLSLKSGIDSSIHNPFAELEQQAKSLRKYAQQRGECAQQKHREARNSFVQRLLTQAEDCYQEAILLAQQTGRAWEKSERVHLELMEISGQKVRRWGQRLKITWQERADAWEKERSGIFESLEIEQKIREIQQHLSETGVRKQQVLDLQKLADQEERNEIGNVCRLIVGKSEILKTHYENAIKAHQDRDVQQAQVSERKAANIRSTINGLSEHLISLQQSITAWKEKYQTEESRYLEAREELQPDGRKKASFIYKKHFVGPLLRIEKFFDQDGNLVEEIKMAAEHLALQLTLGEDTIPFIQKLKENFPGGDFKIEDVFPQAALYRLCFSSSDLDHNPQKLLNLFDEVQKFIKENHLAADCYPDLFSTLSSSKEGEDPLKKKVSEQEEVAEPWAFRSPFGINPPDNLFNKDHPAVGIPTSPILVTIVDSGILATHQAFSREAIRWPDENEEINDFSPYGYDATAVNRFLRNYPSDIHGHGTHIAGIIAGLPHRVTQVEVKKKNETSGEYEYNFYPMTEACIRGVASIPGMLKLLICKNVEPGVPEDGHFISRTIECIHYARERGTQVINCSWGRIRNDSQGICKKNIESLKDVLGNSYNLLTKNDQDQWVPHDPPQAAIPIVAVAAAGNLDEGQPQEEGNRDNLENQYYPANFNLDNIIAVAFSTKEGSLAKRSCYGRQSIHIAAPGTAIISASCSGDNIYRVLSGTSMAVPFVTASIPLMMIKFDGVYSCKKLVDHLCEKANKNNLEDLQVQEGRLDLTRALEVPQSVLTRLELELEEIKKGHSTMP